jgi:DNA-directed RNA polymerase beta' subunit
LEGTAELVDAIKDIGFEYATRSGTTIAIDDIHVPEEKARILEDRQRARGRRSNGSIAVASSPITSAM